MTSHSESTTSGGNPQCPRCGLPVPVDSPAGECPKCLLGAAAMPTEPAMNFQGAHGWPTLDEVRAAFPELEVESEIGRGGMASVFKARQPHLDRMVALKVLAPWLAAEPGFAERFAREARVLSKLSHTNIVVLHDFGQSAGFFHLLMEYVDGVNLRQAMAAGRFTPAQALALVPRICDALEYAHSEGVLHRDIKPDNILLDSRGRLKIADFGIARLTGESEAAHFRTGSGMHLGTPAYMAPEQLERPGEVDHRADIYSLGVVFYEMLTGELPLGRFEVPSAKSSIDSRIDEIVMRTLEKERDRRFQSAEAVKTEVERLDKPPSFRRTESYPGKPSHGVRFGTAKLSGRASGGAACAIVSLALGAGLEFWWLMLGRDTGRFLSETLWILLITFGLALIGAVLGFDGITEIEKQANLQGKRRGFFAVLAWPAFMLNTVLVWHAWENWPAFRTFASGYWMGGQWLGNAYVPMRMLGLPYRFMAHEIWILPLTVAALTVLMWCMVSFILRGRFQRSFRAGKFKSITAILFAAAGFALPWHFPKQVFLRVAMDQQSVEPDMKI